MTTTPEPTAAYPHLRRPRNRVLRAIWWLGHTGEYFHETCGQHHIPGPCRDGVDRNDPKHRTMLKIVDYPPLVALWRIAGVVFVAYGIWLVVR